MKKVYLAGGMRSDWRSLIKYSLQANWLDPTTHGLTKEDEYTAWDLGAIRECDILFGFLDEGNPSGLGLMLEIGWAAALGKEIIFVDKKRSMRPYTGMARAVSDAVFEDFFEGVCYLMDLLVEDEHENTCGR